jgi:hypothetical protein
MFEVMKRLGVATNRVSCVAEALVEKGLEERSISAEVFIALFEACVEMREARHEYESLQDEFVVDVFSEVFEGAGEGGMTS